MDRSIVFRDILTQGRTMRGHNVQAYDVYLWAGLDEGRVDQGEGLHDPLHHHVGCLLRKENVFQTVIPDPYL